MLCGLNGWLLNRLSPAGGDTLALGSATQTRRSTLMAASPTASRHLFGLERQPILHYCECFKIILNQFCCLNLVSTSDHLSSTALALQGIPEALWLVRTVQTGLNRLLQNQIYRLRPEVIRQSLNLLTVQMWAAVPVFVHIYAHWWKRTGQACIKWLYSNIMTECIKMDPNRLLWLCSLISGLHSLITAVTVYSLLIMVMQSDNCGYIVWLL